MSKILDNLNKQLKTEYRQDAEDCLKIYNELKEIDNGHVWASKWTPLVTVIFEGFPSGKRRYKPTAVGYIFLKGIS